MKCGLPPNFFQPTTCDALCNFRVFWQSPRTTKKKLYPIVLLLPGVLTPNVPTRRHAKRESLRTAAMSFKKEYFVRVLSNCAAADEERKKVIKKFQRWVRFPTNDCSVPASDQQGCQLLGILRSWCSALYLS